MSFIYKGFGGFIDSVARYSSNLIFGCIFDLPNPLVTLFVNIFGSLLMVSIFYYTSNNPSEFYKLFFMTGVLGGFTTFSAFSLDSINMFFEKEYQNLFLYVSISVFLSIFSLYLGFIFAKFISS